MGKDRMDFPAVNSYLAELPDKAALVKLEWRISEGVRQ